MKFKEAIAQFPKNKNVGEVDAANYWPVSNFVISVMILGAGPRWLGIWCMLGSYLFISQSTGCSIPLSRCMWSCVQIRLMPWTMESCSAWTSWSISSYWHCLVVKDILLQLLFRSCGILLVALDLFIHIYVIGSSHQVASWCIYCSKSPVFGVPWGSLLGPYFSSCLWLILAKLVETVDFTQISKMMILGFM